MIELLPESEGRFVALRAAGKLTDRDYKQIVPKLEVLIKEHGPIRLLVDMTEFDGWTAMAAWDDLIFGLRHRKDFERIALVGEARWVGLAARMADAVIKGEARRFKTENRQIAWDYILDLD